MCVYLSTTSFSLHHMHTVDVSVSVSVMTVSLAKMAQLIEMLFGG